MSTVDIDIERFIIHFISLGKKSLELLCSEAIRDIRFSVMTLFHPSLSIDETVENIE